MADLRFDGRVAVVTGAGGGLGRRYALDLAARGARVLVNDVGCAPTGDGASTAPAEAVVDEIRSAGGEAVAVRDAFESVQDMAGCNFPASTDDATGFVMGRVLGRAAGPGVATLRPGTPVRS